jgi:hypothetical protein
MSNTTLTADVVAKAALAVLDNELGVLGTFYRDVEDEFANSVNGYKVGSSVRIRRPADFTVRSGETMQVQDVIEGRLTFSVDQVKGVDFNFTGTDLTLSVAQLTDRVIKPAMVRLTNEIAKDCLEEFYKGVYNWVGTPGELINSFSDFTKIPERLDLMAVPDDMRACALHPSDHWAMAGSQTALFVNSIAQPAYRSGSLGQVAGMELYRTAIMPTHTAGTRDNTTPITAAGSGDQSVSYDTVKNTWAQDLVCTGFDNGATIARGDVFTIADLYMVNPVTKQRTAVLQEFVVNEAETADGSGNATLNISPPIITSGPHQTVELSTGTFASNALTFKGTASTGYVQNLGYHKNAFALAMVPMELPAGAVNPARRSLNGISVRVIPVYNGINNTSAWRLDVLYGRKVIDPRLAVRASGSA